MHLLFLGTSASEGYPNAFCDCDNCCAARALGGPSLRKRCSVLINQDLLIDLGPDLMAAAQQYGVSLAAIQYCLQTHEHSDHFDPHHLISRSQYSGVYGNPRLEYYLSAGAVERAGATLRVENVWRLLEDSETDQKLGLQVQVIEPFQRFQAGPYQVFSVRANHAPKLTAMLYVIEQAGRVLFYATDTGEIPDESWRMLAEYGKRFNVVVMDHTFGMQARVEGHMNWEQFVEQIMQMREHDLLAEDARIYAQHIGHHSNPTHPELVTFAQAHGYDVAYDGLRIKI